MSNWWQEKEQTDPTRHVTHFTVSMHLINGITAVTFCPLEWAERTITASI